MKTLSNKKAWVGMAFIAVWLGLAGCASTREHKSTGEYIDDAAITTKVKSEMIADKEVSAHEIHVKTNKGVVHLSGTVESRYEANKAGSIARAVAGVRAVNNDIQVK